MDKDAVSFSSRIFELRGLKTKEDVITEIHAWWEIEKRPKIRAIEKFGGILGKGSDDFTLIVTYFPGTSANMDSCILNLKNFLESESINQISHS